MPKADSSRAVAAEVNGHPGAREKERETLSHPPNQKPQIKVRREMARGCSTSPGRGCHGDAEWRCRGAWS